MTKTYIEYQHMNAVWGRLQTVFKDAVAWIA